MTIEIKQNLLPQHHCALILSQRREKSVVTDIRWQYEIPILPISTLYFFQLYKEVWLICVMWCLIWYAIPSSRFCLLDLTCLAWPGNYYTAFFVVRWKWRGCSDVMWCDTAPTIRADYCCWLSCSDDSMCYRYCAEKRMLPVHTPRKAILRVCCSFIQWDGDVKMY